MEIETICYGSTPHSVGPAGSPSAPAARMSSELSIGHSLFDC